MKIKVLALAAAGILATAPMQAGAADVAAGEKVFKTRCMTCHTAESGKHKVGPSLYGVVGREAGSTDFKRYVGLKGVDFVWNEENIYTYLADPNKFIRENTDNKRSGMAFKLADSEDRKDVIAYLKTLQ